MRVALVVVLLAGAGGAARAQGTPTLEITLPAPDRLATSGPLVLATSMLSSAHSRDPLAAGFPARFHFLVTLWSEGGLANAIERRAEYDVFVRYLIVEKKYEVVQLMNDRAPFSLGKFDHVEDAERAIARPTRVPITSRRFTASAIRGPRSRGASGCSRRACSAEIRGSSRRKRTRFGCRKAAERGRLRPGAECGGGIPKPRLEARSEISTRGGVRNRSARSGTSTRGGVRNRSARSGTSTRGGVRKRNWEFRRDLDEWSVPDPASLFRTPQRIPDPALLRAPPRVDRTYLTSKPREAYVGCSPFFRSDRNAFDAE